MKLSIDSDKLSNLAEQLYKDVRGYCCEASVNIGEINGRVFRLVAIKSDEDEFEGVDPQNECIRGG